MEGEGIIVDSKMEERGGSQWSKRKRGGLGLGDLNLSWKDERRERVDQLNKEMEGLFGYFTEVTAATLDNSAEESPTWGKKKKEKKLEEAVGLLMEGSDLPLTQLVALILRHVAESASPPLVKTAVLSVGHRVCYGLPHPDADLLEDTSPTALWCWEARDVKLLPKPLRAVVGIRRTCRKKIHDRITAVSALIDALQKLELDSRFENDVVRASDKLGKVLAEADIRLLVDGMLQRLTTPGSNDNTVAHREKLLTQELEKNIKQVEREKKRMELELQKERRQHEKDQKRLQEEVEKDEKRREKEELEMRKLVRKQQEEAEKEQRRREKEEAELKKQLAVKKQASIMEKFLKKAKIKSPCQDVRVSNKGNAPDLLSKRNEDMPDAATQLMDHTLLCGDDITVDNIRKSHLSSWHHLGRSKREQHWSIRRKPKSEPIKEIKLTAARELTQDDDLASETLVGGWEGQSSCERTCIDGQDVSSSGVRACRKKMQLLQFDKSNRPAFYGIWPNKSSVVGPRHPLRKDPDLNYDVDSDEEWEEEEPGESLSECDKDEEEESLDQGCSKADDEESEDGFFVPDGYLSENEGVQVDRMEIDAAASEFRSSPSCKEDIQSEEFRTLLSHQKYLSKLTESALRKNQPLIISNLMQEKSPLLAPEDLTSALKLERMCLQSLSICAFPGEPLLPIVVCNNQAEDEDVGVCNNNSCTPPDSTSIIIQELDMPTVVSAIQLCPQSIHKMVESLQQKFPAVSKTQLRNKVRQISEYVDNRWQVKKEILEEVGMPALTPDKRRRRAVQNISTFFKKRCLPPPADNISRREETWAEEEDEPALKPSCAERQVCSFNTAQP